MNHTLNILGIIIVGSIFYQNPSYSYAPIGTILTLITYMTVLSSLNLNPETHIILHPTIYAILTALITGLVFGYFSENALASAILAAVVGGHVGHALGARKYILRQHDYFIAPYRCHGQILTGRITDGFDDTTVGIITGLTTGILIHEFNQIPMAIITISAGIFLIPSIIGCSILCFRQINFLKHKVN